MKSLNIINVTDCEYDDKRYCYNELLQNNHLIRIHFHYSTPHVRKQKIILSQLLQPFLPDIVSFTRSNFFVPLNKKNVMPSLLHVSSILAFNWHFAADIF